MAYCTVADVTQYLGISSGEDSALIGRLIDAAQQAIDDYCHRTFEASADSTKYVDVHHDIVDGYTLFIDHVGDLCAITTVTNGDGNEVTSSQYTTQPRNETPYYALRILLCYRGHYF